MVSNPRHSQSTGSRAPHKHTEVSTVSHVEALNGTGATRAWPLVRPRHAGLTTHVLLPACSILASL